MNSVLTITTLIVLLSTLCTLRLFYILKLSGDHRKRKKSSSGTCGLAVFLGSGTRPGHRGVKLTNLITNV